MEPDYTEAERLYRARKKVKEIREFYEHLTVFILVTIILITINLLTSPGYLWFVWCVLGWGIGLVLHGLSVFNIPPFFGKDWEEKKIKEILEKERLRKSENNYGN
ncbi:MULTISPECIES: 2TM domain-containing protein [unclassified Flavobacterium]|uniref:2TM domain-containing protein n=1 Tax=unclassified Flavobacterium TaxID=196869 RepID=UPI002222972C|nr:MULTISPECIES: 2TM domain-containing protein [unclassified Flavobacterium]